jgi:hypothetical protein
MGPHTRILQILGGWQDVKQVEIYCHPIEGAMRQAMEQATGVKKLPNPKRGRTGAPLHLIEKQPKAPVAQLDRAAVS